nr:MAG TPA: hypothetical protein [Caudoviricetes sp.]
MTIILIINKTHNILFFLFFIEETKSPVEQYRLGFKYIN